MNREAMRRRTKEFALRIIRLSSSLPQNRLGDVLGKQILRSGTSIGANYREALRSSSQKQFISMMEIALREAEETGYWLELIAESESLPAAKLELLADECKQLVAILTATVKSAKRTSRNPKN